jgi:hypothetical protein
MHGMSSVPGFPVAAPRMRRPGAVQASPTVRERPAMNVLVSPARQAVLLTGPARARHEPVPGNPAVAAVYVPVPAGEEPRNTIVLDLTCVIAPQPGDGDLAPLFVMSPARDGWRPYTQLSCTGTDALFIALDGPAVHGDPEDPAVVAGWVRDLSARHRCHAAQLNNHQRWFVNARPGLEIEQKFTLAGTPDIWSLTARTLRKVAAGALDGWIPEHGNNGGFEQWDFLNHIFEITGPAPERGYVAFIPAVDGSWIIRRKWFTADAVIRREDLTDRVDLGPAPDLAAVIRDRYGLAPAWAGCYRRVRYNVLLESLRSGHVFSVMFDRSTDCSGRKTAPAPPAKPSRPSPSSPAESTPTAASGSGPTIFRSIPAGGSTCPGSGGPWPGSSAAAPAAPAAWSPARCSTRTCASR